MFKEVGLMFVTYLGVRVYERNKKKAKKEKKQKFEIRLFQKPSMERTDSQTTREPDPLDYKHYTDMSVVTNSQTIGAPDSLKGYKHYTNMSVVTMGIFGLGKFFPPLVPIGIATYIYTAIPYMRDVEKQLVKERKVNVDVLFFMADALTLGINQYFTAGFGLYLRHSAKMGVEKAKNHSKKMITDVFNQLPQMVWILKDNVEIEVPLTDVKADDTVVVNTGGVIPVDGLIMKGMASVDQQALTGESQPAEKGVGDYVYANTIILTGRIYIKVEKSGTDTTASKISQILVHSTDFKSKVQLKGEEWADMSTFPMVVISVLTLPLIGPENTVVFINSHMGSRIRLLAPLATLKHITMAAHKGILVKDGRSLENLWKVDTIVFDKTGTLTTGEPEVIRTIPCGHYKENEILSLAAMAEGKQTHPIAMAIIKKAEEAHLVWQEIHDSKYQIGYGITVFLDNKKIRVGSIRFITGEGITLPENIKEITESSHENGNTIILVAIDNQVGGAIELQPQVRPEAKEIISQLRQRGIKHIAIVSGDHSHPTQKLAKELGMDEYFYDILPEEKAKIVEQLQKQNRTVCFVGDGINDTIAMKQANVSISLAGATTIATDVAEIIFMDGSLFYISDLFDISNKLNASLKRSLKLTVAPGIINLGSAFFFHFGIMTSLIINVGFSVVGIVNVMKPSKTSQELKALKEKALKEKRD
jgi:heavy metal translocating P-type ATPase